MFDAFVDSAISLPTRPTTLQRYVKPRSGNWEVYARIDTPLDPARKSFTRVVLITVAPPKRP